MCSDDVIHGLRAQGVFAWTFMQKPEFDQIDFLDMYGARSVSRRLVLDTLLPDICAGWAECAGWGEL